jgi:single-strand DNA-binding protein
MAGDTEIHLVGNITDEVALKFTSSGAAVANFTVASTPRFFDKRAQEWRDGDSLFMRCSLWRQAAEHAAESLSQGDRVLVIGKLKQRSYETSDGQKRSVMELEVDEIGPSIKFATVKVSKVGRASHDTSGGSDDPWSSPVQAADDDAPPF